MANIRVGRKSGFILRSGVMRRQTLWFTQAIVRTTLAAASTSVIITSLNAAALALRPFTIVRSRGFLLLRSDQEASSESYEAAYGVTVVTDEAVAIGVTAVPTPVAQSASDWHVFETMFGRFSLGSGVAFTELGHERVIDSKGARKVDLGEDMIEVVETGADSSGAVIASAVRTLIKLH